MPLKYEVFDGRNEKLKEGEVPPGEASLLTRTCIIECDEKDTESRVFQYGKRIEGVVRGGKLFAWVDISKLDPSYLLIKRGETQELKIQSKDGSLKGRVRLRQI